jgi:surface protein
MDKIFYDCKSLISLDISSFDSTKVKNISGLFDSCYSLKKKYIKIRKEDKKILNELNRIQLK